MAAVNVQVTRLARVRTKVRTDLWPDAPQLPESFVRRFPELREFNDELRRFVELVREATEVESSDSAGSTDSCS